jgi:hypothetical protein
MMSKRHRWSHFLRAIPRHGSGEKPRKKQRSRQHHEPSLEQWTLARRSIAFSGLRPNSPPQFPELLSCARPYPAQWLLANAKI